MANDSTFHRMHLDAPKSLGGIGTSKLTADPCLLQPSSKGSLVVWMWYSPSDLSEHSWYSFSWRVFFFRAGTNAVIQPWAGLTCILCLLLPDQTWWRAHALLCMTEMEGKAKKMLANTTAQTPLVLEWGNNHGCKAAQNRNAADVTFFFFPKRGRWCIDGWCVYIYPSLFSCLVTRKLLLLEGRKPSYVLFLVAHSVQTHQYIFEDEVSWERIKKTTVFLVSLLTEADLSAG